MRSNSVDVKRIYCTVSTYRIDINLLWEGNRIQTGRRAEIVLLTPRVFEAWVFGQWPLLAASHACMHVPLPFHFRLILGVVIGASLSLVRRLTDVGEESAERDFLV